MMYNNDSNCIIIIVIVILVYKGEAVYCKHVICYPVCPPFNTFCVNYEHW